MLLVSTMWKESQFGYVVLLSCMQLLKANTKLRGILIINKLVSFTNALSSINFVISNLPLIQFMRFCVKFMPKKSIRVKVLTNIMSGIDKANWMNRMRQRPKLTKVFQEFMLDMKRNTCTLYIFKSFCKQKTGAQRERILFTQTFEFTSSFHQNAQRISSSNSNIQF